MLLLKLLLALIPNDRKMQYWTTKNKLPNSVKMTTKISEIVNSWAKIAIAIMKMTKNQFWNDRNITSNSDICDSKFLSEKIKPRVEWLSVRFCNKKYGIQFPSRSHRTVLPTARYNCDISSNGAVLSARAGTQTRRNRSRRFVACFGVIQRVMKILIVLLFLQCFFVVD